MLPGLLFLSSITGIAQANPEFESWIRMQREASVTKLLANISRVDTAPGTIVASPSKSDPDYYYHWVRDGALVADVLISAYDTESDSNRKKHLGKILRDWVTLSQKQQTIKTLSGLGEPKFNADGSAFNDPWGRPQNDGPALRAIALIRLARILLKEGHGSYVTKTLYDSTHPTQSVIKKDLEHVSHEWRKPTFDLWEEVRGDHLYTRIVQKRALLDGAALARDLNDAGAAEWYQGQANTINQAIAQHWNPALRLWIPTLNRDTGPDKPADIDTAVILGSLHGTAHDAKPASHSLSPSTDAMLSSALAAKKAFSGLYAINRAGFPAVAIGRYPEDTYYGGNPWVLTTAAFAELNYRIAREINTAGKLRVTALNAPFFKDIGFDAETGDVIQKGSPRFRELLKKLKDEGDSYLKRIRVHGYASGSLSEQIDKTTGHMMSASDLTWNYASVLTALWHRDRLAVPTQ